MMAKPKISRKSKKIKPPKKIRLAFYGDSPTCISGFATVSRNILLGLHATKRFDIEVYGINYWGEPHDLPFNIWPVCFNHDLNGQSDPFGQKKMIDLLTNHKRRYDVYFFLNNPHKLTFLPTVKTRLKHAEHQFADIVYYPIDATPKKEWLENIKDADKIVAYSEYGMKETLNVLPELGPKVNYIYHGVEPEDFFPLPKSQRFLCKRNLFGIDEDTFLITNVNRNQLRKDIPRTMMAFKEFKKKVPNSLLYLHMAQKDVGGDLIEISQNLGLKRGEDIKFSGNDFSPAKGITVEVLNKIYNASDLIVSSSTGEGWGLSSIEAMAAKRPCLFPEHTTLKEIFDNGRGKLIKAGGDNEHCAFVPEEPVRMRPIVHVNDMAGKMFWMYNNPAKVHCMVEKAYKWVKQKLLWDKHIIPQWVKLIDNALEQSGKRKTKISSRTKNYIEYI